MRLPTLSRLVWVLGNNNVRSFCQEKCLVCACFLIARWSHVSEIICYNQIMIINTESRSRSIPNAPSSLIQPICNCSLLRSKFAPTVTPYPMLFKLTSNHSTIVSLTVTKWWIHIPVKQVKVSPCWMLPHARRTDARRSEIIAPPLLNIGNQRRFLVSVAFQLKCLRKRTRLPFSTTLGSSWGQSARRGRVEIICLYRESNRNCPTDYSKWPSVINFHSHKTVLHVVVTVPLLQLQWT